jgi:hypothetical protein
MTTVHQESLEIKKKVFYTVACMSIFVSISGSLRSRLGRDSWCFELVPCFLGEIKITLAPYAIDDVAIELCFLFHQPQRPISGFRSKIRLRLLARPNISDVCVPSKF